MLASNVLVADSLERAELLAYRPEVSLAALRYVAVCVPGRERQAQVRGFLTWLAEAATAA